VQRSHGRIQQIINTLLEVLKLDAEMYGEFVDAINKAIGGRVFFSHKTLERYQQRHKGCHCVVDGHLTFVPRLDVLYRMRPYYETVYNKLGETFWKDMVTKIVARLSEVLGNPP
jgi:hypothetical protein